MHLASEHVTHEGAPPPGHEAVPPPPPFCSALAVEPEVEPSLSPSLCCACAAQPVDDQPTADTNNITIIERMMTPSLSLAFASVFRSPREKLIRAVLLQRE